MRGNKSKKHAELALREVAKWPRWKLMFAADVYSWPIEEIEKILKKYKRK